LLGVAPSRSALAGLWIAAQAVMWPTGGEAGDSYLRPVPNGSSFLGTLAGAVALGEVVLATGEPVVEGVLPARLDAVAGAAAAPPPEPAAGRPGCAPSGAVPSLLLPAGAVCAALVPALLAMSPCDGSALVAIAGDELSLPAAPSAAAGRRPNTANASPPATSTDAANAAVSHPAERRTGRGPTFWLANAAAVAWTGGAGAQGAGGPPPATVAVGGGPAGPGCTPIAGICGNGVVAGLAPVDETKPGGANAGLDATVGP
jgi:hypothetical protein